MGSHDKVTITVTLGNLMDRITIVKVVDGSDGETGKDVFTVFMTNETHTFPTTFRLLKQVV